MFKPTSAKSPDEYLDMIDDAERKAEMIEIHELIQKTLPGYEPRILGGMIGYGTYHYKSKSGREGDWSLIALASQKNYISVYVCSVNETGYVAEAYKDALPKADIGKSCVRFKHLKDIDTKILVDMLKEAEKTGPMSMG